MVETPGRIANAEAFEFGQVAPNCIVLVDFGELKGDTGRSLVAILNGVVVLAGIVLVQFWPAGLNAVFGDSQFFNGF